MLPLPLLVHLKFCLSVGPSPRRLGVVSGGLEMIICPSIFNRYDSLVDTHPYETVGFICLFVVSFDIPFYVGEVKSCFRCHLVSQAVYQIISDRGGCAPCFCTSIGYNKMLLFSLCLVRRYYLCQHVCIHTVVLLRYLYSMIISVTLQSERSHDNAANQSRAQLTDNLNGLVSRMLRPSSAESSCL